MADKHAAPQFELTEAGRLLCQGDWTIQNLRRLPAELQALTPKSQTLIIDGQALSALDTAGAWALNHMVKRLQAQDINTTLENFSDKQSNLLAFVQSQDDETPESKALPQWLAQIGIASLAGLKQCQDYLAFTGECMLYLLRTCTHPKRFRTIAFLSNIESTGYEAILIVSLLSFLIGVVLAYQVGIQLEEYGANIFIVELLGIALLREFSPLITAIIVAGRTSSAFTAQIGTMKIREELDALTTLGVSPLECLVLPKILALTIALPLLTVLSEILGIFGGMILAKAMLGVSFPEFLDRLQSVIPLRTFIVGLVKTPVFALVIASIGCFQGFRVRGSAQSVGEKTTISVVQSIFCIIVIDAVFSVLYSWFDL